MSRLFLIIVVLMGITDVSFSQEFVGKWSNALEYCGTDYSDQHLLILKNKLMETGSDCEFTKIKKNKSSDYTVSMKCIDLLGDSETGTFTSLMRIIVSGSGKKLKQIYLDQGNQTNEWVKCK